MRPRDARVVAIKAAMHLRGGQCGLCARALWRRGRVVGCGVGDRLEGELGAVAGILAGLLYQLAQAPRAAPCSARDPLPVLPDAYLAIDAPEGGPGPIPA